MATIKENLGKYNLEAVMSYLELEKKKKKTGGRKRRWYFGPLNQTS